MAVNPLRKGQARKGLLKGEIVGFARSPNEPLELMQVCERRYEMNRQLGSMFCFEATPRYR
jgi:hypothetical protein